MSQAAKRRIVVVEKALRPHGFDEKNGKTPAGVLSVPSPKKPSPVAEAARKAGSPSVPTPKAAPAPTGKAKPVPAQKQPKQKPYDGPRLMMGDESDFLDVFLGPEGN